MRLWTFEPSILRISIIDHRVALRLLPMSDVKLDLERLGMNLNKVPRKLIFKLYHDPFIIM